MKVLITRTPALQAGPWGAIPLTLCAAALLSAFAPTSSLALEPTTQQMLAPITVHGQAGGTLTVPSTQEAREIIQRTAGGVALVPDTVWSNTQAATVKDILDYTPGVFAQPKWGEDTRLSIRGSGLSRYYHLRGVGLYQDGVPLNNADGSSDFQWVDPTAYRYTEVYKGGNALRYGASTLGGAVNFVTPTGRDAEPFQGRTDVGSFGWRRLQMSTAYDGGQWDGFITGSWQRQDGFRDHSAGNSLRVSANVGWRPLEHIETRLYLTGVRVRQEIPGALVREQALRNPREAAAANKQNDWQRNVDGARVSSRTVINIGATTYEFGSWFSQSHLRHPIYQYLDNGYNDYGAYTRIKNAAPLAGHKNSFTLGVTWSAGTVQARNYQNVGGRKGSKLSETHDKSNNIMLYGENAFDIVPGVSLIAGLQYLHAERDRHDKFNGTSAATRSGKKSYGFFNPKLGVLWQLNSHWQVYGNISRSAEPPTFGDMNFSTANDLDRLKAQRATTFEVGTRGKSGDFSWDVSAYHARISNEFQCLSSQWNICDRTSNLDHTIHQGLEAGFNWVFLKGLFGVGTEKDRMVLNVAYTFSDFRFKRDAVWGNKQLPGVPRHYLRAEVMYKHPAGFFAGPNIEWAPQAYYADNTNSVKTTPYALLGLRAGLERDSYSVFVEGRNLMDKRYIASVSATDLARPGSTLYEPGTGRAVFAGLRVYY